MFTLGFPIEKKIDNLIINFIIIKFRDDNHPCILSKKYLDKYPNCFFLPMNDLVKLICA